MHLETTPETPITLEAALDLFLLDCAARRLTAATLQNYRAKLAPFVAWLQAQELRTVAGLTAPRIRLYQASIVERGLSAQYQHNIARAIKVWVRFLEREDVLRKAPNVTMPKLPKRILPALTSDELKTILRACKSNRRDMALILTLLDTGVRAGELCRLNVDSINLQSGAVFVQQGKGQKDRIVYMGYRTRKAFVRYLAERGETQPGAPAFASERGGGRLTVWAIVQLLERLRRATGIKTLTAHALRRTFAVTCLRNGMNVYVLARLMGHADIQMLRKYLDLVQDDLAEAHDQHGPVDHLLK